MAANWQTGLEPFLQAYSAGTAYTVQHVYAGSATAPTLVIAGNCPNHPATGNVFAQWQAGFEQAVLGFATGRGIILQVTRALFELGTTQIFQIIAKPPGDSANGNAPPPVRSPSQRAQPVFSTFTTADRLRTTIVNGAVTKLPERIRSVVTQYSEDTNRFGAWLIREVLQFQNITDTNRIGSVENFVRMATVITTEECAFPLLHNAQRIAELREIIRQRHNVCIWYSNMATDRGLQGGAVVEKTFRHKYFIGVLCRVLITLERYQELA
ncbi:hypothetical protein LTR36_003517 [Oleoguttula mirabilis]|uniref:Uncharacterized protein n=1 Tax=Oleoguttula mirabilis TaxID=1507867 RepID=A0AAV9JLG6_9PEZI|nr:hypothetical protein LTR36_003517 [Oleoguttula mirabilis]